MLLLNTAMLSGHSSTESVMSFPKNDIRDLSSEPVLEASTLATDINGISGATGPTKLGYFTANYSKFISDMKTAYTARGALIDIKYTPNATDMRIDRVNVSVSYENGNTYFQDNYIVYT